jgi:hypothetical protein
MRGLATGALVIALGLGTVARAAGDEDSDKSGTAPARNPLGFHWSPTFAHAMGLDLEKPPPPKKPAAKPKKTAAKETPPAPKPAPIADEGTALRGREEAALLRRLAVCDKLKEIALRSNDSDLLARAEALDERARTTYEDHMARLRAGSKQVDLDEQILEQHLGAAASAKRVQGPALTASANAQNHGGRATAQEDKR